MCRVAAGPIVWIWPEPAPAEGSEAMSATAVLPPRIIPARPRVLKPPRKRPPQRETPRPEPRETAQERLQETMVRAWRNLDVLVCDPELLRPWLVTVGHRIAIDRLRARAVRPRETEADPLDQVPERAEPFEQVLDRGVVWKALAGLSEAHRAVLLHVYILDHT